MDFSQPARASLLPAAWLEAAAALDLPRAAALPTAHPARRNSAPASGFVAARSDRTIAPQALRPSQDNPRSPGLARRPTSPPLISSPYSSPFRCPQTPSDLLDLFRRFPAPDFTSQ